jgi:O-antigen ligase
MARTGAPLETTQIVKPSHIWAMALVLMAIVLGPMLLLPSPYNLLPFVLLGGSLFLFTSFRQPFVGLFVYLIIFFFRPYEIWPAPVPYEKIIGLVILIILSVHLIVKRIEIRFNRLDWAVAGVVIAAALSVPSFTEMGDNTMSFYAWFDFFKIFLVYFFTLQIANSKNKLEAIVWLYVLSNIYLAGTTSYNYYAGHYRVSMGIARARGMAEQGLFSHPNSVANSTVLGLPFLYYFLRHYRNLVIKLFLIAVLALSVWTVVITGSRGGMIGLFVFVLIIGWRSKYRAFSLAASAVAILVLVAIMPEQYQGRLFSLTNVFGTDTTGAAESAAGRIEGLLTGLKFFLMRPLTGVGIGAFPRAHFITVGIYAAAHNLLGQLLGELGTVGLVAFTWFMVTKVRYARDLVNEYGKQLWPDDILSKVTKAVQIALILIFVQGISGSNLFRYNWYIFACFLSIITFATADRIRRERPSLPADQPDAGKPAPPDSEGL